MIDDLESQDFVKKDPSWVLAQDITAKYFDVPSHIWRLFRLSWAGQLEMDEFIKNLGFSAVPLGCLFRAAERGDGKEGLGKEELERSISMLGLRYSAVVLAINFSCRTLLRAKPGFGWRKSFEDLMVDVEIGYRLGSKVFELGVEGGSLMGFAGKIGEIFLLLHNPTAFKKWLVWKKEGVLTKADAANEAFGCEPEQIAAFVVQRLGFGVEMALGVAQSTARFMKNDALDEPALRWKAALKWIEALREGRNHPREPELRNVFSELALQGPPGKQKSLSLEVLWTELGKLRTGKSQWTWHLPRPTYEETATAFNLGK